MEKIDGKIDKSAGFKRNQEMVDIADEMWAFWDEVSGGTKHSMERAEKKE
jgi:hypothetical protein